MKNVKIFQIFYSEATKISNDQGFLPLDNMANLRPDWREYWPIRNYLLSNELDEESWYGFFSPKFGQKTGLSSKDCLEFINSHSNEVDVFSFSPFFDLGAWYQNSILQAIPQHPNLKFPMEGALNIINLQGDIDQIVMHSGNNIFCNFFVAKPSFWRVWLEKCELIWIECEDGNSLTAKGLNTIAEGHDSPATIKTFVIERIASLILSTNNKWNVKAYNPLNLPFSNGLISKERNALIQMDALKMAYALNGRVEYLNLFKSVANLVTQKLRLEQQQ
jgi:hypothetical protein